MCAAAGIQAPTLYRLFGDKEGLLDAVASYGFQDYLADKQALGQSEDPVADLRRAWHLHIDRGPARGATPVRDEFLVARRERSARRMARPHHERHLSLGGAVTGAGVRLSLSPPAPPGPSPGGATARG
ncbi:TetR/AcrR family transcriptional regulator [Nonomuraea terrae]|uniref:TetR/AcrR family transcriptional regulator n=1 Tax=Nonomuraea terrae TaxID=2530383 RepID=UPI00319DA420